MQDGARLLQRLKAAGLPRYRLNVRPYRKAPAGPCASDRCQRLIPGVKMSILPGCFSIPLVGKSLACIEAKARIG